MALFVSSPFPNISPSHEKNVPALPKTSCPSIRFPGAHAHQGRSRHPGSSPGEGTCPSRRCENRTQVQPSHRSLGFSPVAAVYDCRSSEIHSASTQASSGSPEASRSQALPRARIIRRRAIFDATRIKGRRVSNRYMALNFLPHDPVKPDQGTVAFLTPKRLGGAVKRNKLRRQMREIYRRYLAQPSENSYLIWVARPPALELDFEGLKKTMSELKERQK